MKSKETMMRIENRKTFLNEVGLNENEFHCVCDSLNGIILNIDYLNCANSLIDGLSESNVYNKLDKKWKINYNKLKLKLLNLSYDNILRLLIEVDAFWGAGSVNKYFGRKSPLELLTEYLDESRETQINREVDGK